MSDRQTQAIRTLVTEQLASEKITKAFLTRLGKGALTRDENPATHFCVFFAGYDPIAKEVFLGHHKKSGLWLFNGGHIDRNETPTEALVREIREEWDVQVLEKTIGAPKLLTLTNVLPNPNITCTHHYDIWYFVRLNKQIFKPDQRLLAKEFHEARWLTLKEGRHLATDTNTHQAIRYINNISR